MKQTLFLVRGLPGSGKSTLANRISPIVIEADEWFLEHGVYVFNPLELKEAHADCLARTAEALRRGEDIVAVANTFSRNWEMDAYYLLRGDHNVIEVTVHAHLLSDEQLAARCIHKVPVETIRRMRERWEA